MSKEERHERQEALRSYVGSVSNTTPSDTRLQHIQVRQRNRMVMMVVVVMVMMMRMIMVYVP